MAQEPAQGQGLSQGQARQRKTLKQRRAELADPAKRQQIIDEEIARLRRVKNSPRTSPQVKQAIEAEIASIQANGAAFIAQRQAVTDQVIAELEAYIG